jgi:uncharacterized membrane protein YfhO
MKKRGFFIIFTSFITAAVLAAVIFAFSGIYPGSERILFVFDMLEQFAAFYSSLKGLFNGGVSLFYTFHGSIGTPYMGTYAYYLASPFSYITCLFDTEHLPDAIWLMDIIKASVIGAAFSAFAYSRGVRKPFANIVLSMCYALSSAAVTFFILPMYLDAMYMLPILCILLERLIKGERGRKSVKRGLAYSVILGIGILIHYYSMYMVCIFLAMYAVYLLTEDEYAFSYALSDSEDEQEISVNRSIGNPEKSRKSRKQCDHCSKKKSGKRKEKDAKSLIKKYVEFVLYSLGGVILSLPVLILVVRELLKGKVSDSGVYSTGDLIVTSLPDLLKQFIYGHYGSLYSEGAPYIYCTLIVFIIALYGLWKSRDSITNRICGFCILIIMLCSFVFRPMYRVWHMFRDPVAYPHRFSFLFVFFVMVLAIKGLNVLAKQGRAFRLINLIVGLIMIFFVVLNGVKVTDAEFETLPGTTRSLYNEFLDNTVPLIAKAQEDSSSGNEYGVSLCRINKGYEFTSNDPMLLGFNGIDLFSSSYDSRVLDFYKNLGLLQYHYKACDQGTTLVTDMLLGVDYQIYGSNAEYGYDWIATNNYFYFLYKNPYSLGIGYLGGDDICSFGDDAIQNQNILFGSIMGEQTDVFVPIEFYDRTYNMTGAYETGDLNIYDRRSLFFAPQNGLNLYMNYDLVRESELDYDTKSNSEMFRVLLNDRLRHTFTGYQRAYNMYLGRNFYENEEYVVEIYGDNENRPLHVYVMDLEKLGEAYKELESGRFIADSITPGHVTGRINVISESRNELIFTIAYDERFRAYVDGERVETIAYAGALLTIPDLSVGEHYVELKYR